MGLDWMAAATNSSGPKCRFCALRSLSFVAFAPKLWTVLRSACQCNTLAILTANRYLSGNSVVITASWSPYPDSWHSVVLLAAMQNHHLRPVWLSPLRSLGGDIMSASRASAASQPGLVPLDPILSLRSLRSLRPILIGSRPDLVWPLKSARQSKQKSRPHSAQSRQAHRVQAFARAMPGMTPKCHRDTHWHTCCIHACHEWSFRPRKHVWYTCASAATFDFVESEAENASFGYPLGGVLLVQGIYGDMGLAWIPCDSFDSESTVGLSYCGGWNCWSGSSSNQFWQDTRHFSCFSRERLRRVLRKKAAVILHLHTFTSADLHLHTFTSADLHLHTLTPADLDLHTFTPADLDLHTFTPADLDLHTFTSADLHLHTLTSADLHLHTLTSADLHLHTPWHLQI